MRAALTFYAWGGIDWIRPLGERLNWPLSLRGLVRGTANFEPTWPSSYVRIALTGVVQLARAWSNRRD
jgi:hypothetical protein